MGWPATYLLCLALAFHDPVFYDNNVPETVVFPGHFWLALAVVAVTIVGPG